MRRSVLYDIPDFQEIIKNSVSIRDALTKCKIGSVGANYVTFKKVVAKLEIDISHFNGQGQKGKHKKPRSLENDFVRMQKMQE